MDSTHYIKELHDSSNRWVRGIQGQEKRALVHPVRSGGLLLEQQRAVDAAASIVHTSTNKCGFWEVAAESLEIKHFLVSVAEELTALGLEKRAERLMSCCTENFWLACGCQKKAVANRCEDYRVCPHCGEARHKKIYWRLFHTFIHSLKHLRPGHTHKLLTLTLPKQENLHKGFEILSESLRKLYAHNIWKKNVRSWVCTIEPKPLPDGSWHVHAHMVIDSKYIDNKTISPKTGRTPLQDAWWKASKAAGGDKRIVHLEKCDSSKGAVGYLIKYVTKPMFLDNKTGELVPGASPKKVADFMVVMKGRRLLRWGGEWRGLFETQKTSGCPECGLKFHYCANEGDADNRISWWDMESSKWFESGYAGGPAPKGCGSRGNLNYHPKADCTGKIWGDGGG